MKTNDLVRFAERPWEVIGEGDAEYWLARKRELGPAEGVRMAAELRARSWPKRAEFYHENPASGAGFSWYSSLR